MDLDTEPAGTASRTATPIDSSRSDERLNRRGLPNLQRTGDVAANFSCTAGRTLSSIGHPAPLRAPVLREAQGRIPELEEILCADPDTALHLGLGGHDVEAILSNPGDDLLGHLGGRVAASEPVGESLTEGLRHRSRLAFLGELGGAIPRRAHDGGVFEGWTDHRDADRRAHQAQLLVHAL